jgi:hypothetical protein
MEAIHGFPSFSNCRDVKLCFIIGASILILSVPVLFWEQDINGIRQNIRK